MSGLGSTEADISDWGWGRRGQFRELHSRDDDAEQLSLLVVFEFPAFGATVPRWRVGALARWWAPPGRAAALVADDGVTTHCPFGANHAAGERDEPGKRKGGVTRQYGAFIIVMKCSIWPSPTTARPQTAHPPV
jgi:hypothetical protein